MLCYYNVKYSLFNCHLSLFRQASWIESSSDFESSSHFKTSSFDITSSDRNYFSYTSKLHTYIAMVLHLLRFPFRWIRKLRLCRHTCPHHYSPCGLFLLSLFYWHGMKKQIPSWIHRRRCTLRVISNLLYLTVIDAKSKCITHMAVLEKLSVAKDTHWTMYLNLESCPKIY